MFGDAGICLLFGVFHETNATLLDIYFYGPVEKCDVKVQSCIGRNAGWATRMKTESSSRNISYFPIKFIHKAQIFFRAPNCKNITLKQLNNQK